MTDLVPAPMLMYPSGAGGHWLMNTLNRLMFHPYKSNLRGATDSYHGTDIWPIHYDDHWVIRNNKDSLYFSDKCIFNFYINYVEKLMIMDKIEKEKQNPFISLYKIIDQIIDWHEKFESIKNHPGFLSYTSLWSDPDQFRKQFNYAWKNAFSEAGYLKDYQQDNLDTAIEEFKISVVNPIKYYNQLDSKVWLTWCWYLSVRYNLIDEQKAMLINGLEGKDPEILYDLAFWDLNPDLFLEQIKRSYKSCLEITHDMIYFYPES